MSTFTNSNTFTVTNAKYLASKIAADLYQIQRFYGKPTDSAIEAYSEEVSILLKSGYLESIEYGFKKNDKWVLAVSYTVAQLNGLDNNPGRVPIGVDISGATWGSYLTKNAAFYNLSTSEQARIEATLPVNRGGGVDPKAGLSSTQDRSYSSGGVDISRRIYK